MRICVRSPHSARKMTMNAVLATVGWSPPRARRSLLHGPGSPPGAPGPPHEEHRSHDHIHRPVRQDAEQGHADRHGDHHVDEKAPAAPSQTENGLPRVDNTRDANMVLSGSSPMKMIGKTATTTAKFTLTFLAGSKGSPSSRPRRHGRNEGLAHLRTGPVTGLLAEPACRPPIAGYSPSQERYRI